MNDKLRDALGQLVSNRIQRNLADNEDLANVLNILGKPILEAKTAQSPTLAEIKSLKSETKTSSKGAYQLISKAENLGNPVFSMLQNYLRDHKGYVVLHGLKMWSFDNPDKIGYRKQ